MITIHPCFSLLIYFICTNINNWIMANHPFYKHHLKSPPHVTPFCIQSNTTIYTKIQPYALVHKIPTRKPDILLLLQFIHTSIIVGNNVVDSFMISWLSLFVAYFCTYVHTIHLLTLVGTICLPTFMSIWYCTN